MVVIIEITIDLFVSDMMQTIFFSTEVGKCVFVVIVWLVAKSTRVQVREKAQIRFFHNFTKRIQT